MNTDNKDPMQLRWPPDLKSRLCLVFLGLVLCFGGFGAGMQCRDWVVDTLFNMLANRLPLPAALRQGRNIPVSKLPGPPRQTGTVFLLDEPGAAAPMTGIDDEDQRWADVAGNYYTGAFIEAFSYEAAGTAGPQVRVRYKRRGPTCEGRLEARRLKPNFAYQLKLQGDFRNRERYETIGRLGRWRLPGKKTNYIDRDYDEYPESAKGDVEAYILFDFFVTDGDGNAVREFSLDSSLHVLWNAIRQHSGGVPRADQVEVAVFAGNPAYYGKIKSRGTREFIWAEREAARYTAADQLIRLPPGKYEAFLALTEESFHAIDRDGGHWATVMRLPVSFEIVAAGAPVAAGE
ncbi:MAG: hypothetical protein QGF67_16445 [Lentisphaeria bacterium]|jgi:hypothetical protein|nr:hypothetical protein [Lentisphaeria bacterium]